MKKPIILTSGTAALMYILLSSFALAADSTLAVTGNVIASSCDVDIGSVNQKIKIGTFSGKDFPSVGSTSAFKAMNINLSNCYEKLKTIQVTFSGTSDADNPALLALTSSGSGNTLATGVGVELLDSSGKTIPFDKVSPQTFDLDAGDNTLSFLLRYKSTRYPVTAGEASAVMYFDLTYQ
ncbi:MULTISPECIES: fimbrial protein [Enterobacter]|uniref:Fimbrial protein n=1 Tax=Enterobacter vonholyi TaxID=2797505 RepID=A0ABU6E626_9ENTR|nr:MULTISPECIES: fimbrial protein [Enterobacter]MCK7256927.1 fimbrial protein [Enterobacter asburiae]MCM7618097.1 fimbrial protein [Enterobacter vonholyi]MEB6411008.1 fimbrial protein [Enterobacter vonholyi]MEB7625522.1 fimbrial protein [Enterobacter vonholyi]BBJ66360.1 fimbrial protein BcfE [Enterobacter sp. 18A13]